jgi:hypothetical protein
VRDSELAKNAISNLDDLVLVLFDKQEQVQLVINNRPAQDNRPDHHAEEDMHAEEYDRQEQFITDAYEAMGKLISLKDSVKSAISSKNHAALREILPMIPNALHQARRLYDVRLAEEAMTKLDDLELELYDKQQDVDSAIEHGLAQSESHTLAYSEFSRQTARAMELLRLLKTKIETTIESKNHMTLQRLLLDIQDKLLLIRRVHDNRVAAIGPVANMPQPVVGMQQGVPFEIHNAFNTFPLAAYTKTIKKHVNKKFEDFEGDITESNAVYRYVIDKLKENLERYDATIGNNNKTSKEIKEKIEEKIKSDLEALNQIYIAIHDAWVDKEKLTAIVLTIQFVLSTENQEFINLYSDSYIQDCMNAYNKGNPVSCTKGMIERFILSIKNPLVAFCSKKNNNNNLPACLPGMEDLYKFFHFDEKELMDKLYSEWICSVIKKHNEYEGERIEDLQEDKTVTVNKEELIESLNKTFYDGFKNALPNVIKKEEIMQIYEKYIDRVITAINDDTLEFTGYPNYPCDESHAGGGRQNRIKSKRSKSLYKSKSFCNLQTKKRKHKGKAAN